MQMLMLLLKLSLYYSLFNELTLETKQIEYFCHCFFVATPFCCTQLGTGTTVDVIPLMKNVKNFNGNYIKLFAV